MLVNWLKYNTTVNQSLTLHCLKTSQQTTTLSCTFFPGNIRDHFLLTLEVFSLKLQNHEILCKHIDYIALATYLVSYVLSSNIC